MHIPSGRVFAACSAAIAVISMSACSGHQSTIPSSARAPQKWKVLGSPEHPVNEGDMAKLRHPNDCLAASAGKRKAQDVGCTDDQSGINSGDSGVDAAYGALQQIGSVSTTYHDWNNNALLYVYEAGYNAGQTDFGGGISAPEVVATIQGPANAGDTCPPAPLAIGSPVAPNPPNDNSPHHDGAAVTDITPVFMMNTSGGIQVSTPFGWVYSTVNDGNWFQANVAFTGGLNVGPLAASGTLFAPSAVQMGPVTTANLTAALNAALAAMVAAGYVLNPTVSQAIKSGNIGTGHCFSKAWAG
jgi:hypothetical protein